MGDILWVLEDIPPKLVFKFAFMGKFLQLYRFVPVVLLVLPPLDQPTLLDDLNPQPSTRLAQQHRLRQVEAKVEAEVEAG